MNSRETAQFAGRIRDCARQLGQRGVSALGPLYDLTASRLLAYACTITRNHGDAEDAVHAAMMNIAMKPKGMCVAEFPWAYFLKVVRNESLAILRRRTNHELPHQIALPNFDEDAGDRFELEQFVRSALGKLPPEQAEVVVLKIWEDMTFLEIGEVLGESANTAASRYRYAIQKLSHSLQPFSRDAIYE